MESLHLGFHLQHPGEVPETDGPHLSGSPASLHSHAVWLLAHPQHPADALCQLSRELSLQPAPRGLSRHNNPSSIQILCLFLFKKSLFFIFLPIGLFNSALQWSFDHLQAAGCSAMATCSPIHHFPAAALPKTQRYGLLLVCIIMAYKCDEASLTTQ